MIDTHDLLHLPLYQRGSLFGASLVASELDDSNIVVWGPRGCTSQIFDAMFMQRQEYRYHHYTASEADILIDGISALKRGLLPQIAAYVMKGPLFLFLGDAPQLTTENVEEFVQSNVSGGFPIVYVGTGFKGDYYEGINETLYKLTKKFCTQKITSQRNLINLIPEVGTSPQWRGNVEEISRILAKLGFEVNVIVNKSSIQDIAKMAAASYTLLLNSKIGNETAKFLQDKFDIPALTTRNMPIGHMGTELWLKELANCVDGPMPDIEEIIEQEKVHYFLKMKPALREENYNFKINIIRTSKFLICDEFNRALQWSRFLINEFNCKGGYIFPTTGFDQNRLNECEGVEIIKDTLSLISCCEDKDIALVLGSDWINELLQQKIDNLICVSSPVVKKITLISKPYYGFRGALHFLEDVLNCVDY